MDVLVNRRKKLSASMTLSQFEHGYWYATQLKDFGETIGIPSASKLRKDRLERANMFDSTRPRSHSRKFHTEGISIS
jgi:hypothetical protein